MVGDKKLKKQDIKPSDIKANIYDSVELIIDIHGVARQDIEYVLEKLSEILPAEYYSRIDDSLTPQEINDYGDRRENILSWATRKRYLDTESVVRYYSKDNSEKITISRLFISIYLSYEIAHVLKANIELLDKIVEVFNTLEYFEVEKIFLVKKDSIYCSSLDKMYQCFDRKMFADVGYLLGRKAQGIDYGVTRVYNNLSYGNAEVIVNKEIMEGILSDSNELVYEGKMETIVSQEPSEDEVSINGVLNELNSISFDVFMCHITDSFARDLVDGQSSKVKMGVNCYE